MELLAKYELLKLGQAILALESKQPVLEVLLRLERGEVNLREAVELLESFRLSEQANSLLHSRK